MYGQTETSTRISHLLPKNSKIKIGSVGKPIPGVELKIVNDEGKEAQIEEIGEIIVKGSNIMKGYYKRNELTQQSIHDGWLFTGDMGKLDRDGFLYIVGRKKNVIIKGGMNIYPEEIEEIILLNPIVEEVCVYGESNELLGEVPIARVILKSNAVNIKEDDLKRYCFRNMTSFKIPDRFEFVTELPKTDSGKIIRTPFQ